MRSLEIRRLVHVDLAHCAAIDSNAAAVRPAWRGENFERFLDWPCHGGFVALWHGNIIAYVLYQADREHRRLYLVRIGVAPSWQRRHVGSCLVQYVRHWLRPMPEV